MRCFLAGQAASNSTQWGPTRCCCPLRVSSSDKGWPTVAAVQLLTATASTSALLLLYPHLAYARIAIDQLPTVQQQQQQLGREQSGLTGSTAGFEPSEVGQIRARAVGDANRGRVRSTRQQSVTATEALEALQQLRAAEGLFKQADYAGALLGYSQVVQQHPDLALTEYARMGQALCLYQEGRTSQALTELNELELDLRGNPETHAALAAVLYAERPAQRWRAEQQWDIALEFDSRYQDPAWVRDTKHWPPRLLEALDRFLALG